MLVALSNRFNQWLGPFLLKNGLKARCFLSGGVVIQGSLLLDTLVGLQLAKRLVMLHVRDATDRAVADATTDSTAFRSSFWNFWSKTTNPVSTATGEKTSTQSPSSTSRGSGDSRTSDTLRPDEEGYLRLSVFEKCIRPALLPNEKWSDVQKWQFDKRLIQWIRQEYLYAAHIARVRAAFLVYPNLSSIQQLAPKRLTLPRLLTGKLPFDNSFTTRFDEHALSKLPSTALVTKAFDLHEWATRKKSDSAAKRMAPVAQRLGGSVVTLRGGALCLPIIGGGDDDDDGSDNADLSPLSLGEVLELVGGHVTDCGPLNLACEERNIFQLWTREYIEGLGQYLQGRVDSFEGETLILEVGAGDGLLAEALRDFFQNNASTGSIKYHSGHVKQSTARKANYNREKSSNQRSSHPRTTRVPTVIATDDGSWGIRQSAEVKQMAFPLALEKYCQTRVDDTRLQEQQVIVLCSWMPMQEDWSSDFRRYKVNEYILIGECDDGQCGDNWKTWGNVHMHTDTEALSKELDEKLGLRKGDIDNPRSTDNAGNGDKEMTSHKDLESQPIPPYRRDAYVRRNLDHLAVHQFSRFDCATCKAGTTVSFRFQNSSSQVNQE